MQLNEVTQKVNTLAKSWEEFKSINDQRLNQIEQKKQVDPLIEEQIKKINYSLSEQKQKLDNFDLYNSRPNCESDYYKSDELNYKNAFIDYLRKGSESKLNSLKESSLNSISDPDGGYLIRPQLSNKFGTEIKNQVAMRELASVQEISTDYLDIIEDEGNFGVGWVTEVQERDNSKTANFTKKRIVVHEMFAQPRATQKLIDDSLINVEQWLNDKLVENFAELESKAFIYGDGVGKPKGILSYADGQGSDKIEQIKSSNLSAEDLIKLYFTLDNKYIKNATFLLNNYTLGQIRTLKCKDSGQYIWSPSLESKISDKILGLPIKIESNMPDFSKSSIAIALSDFKKSYKIVDRSGIRVLRDPFTNKPFIKFYTTKRVGGDVANCRAIKLLSCAS